LAGLSNPGSLVAETHGSTITLAQASIAGADVSTLDTMTQNLELTSTLLSGAGAGGGSGVSSPAAPSVVYPNTLAGFTSSGLVTMPPGISIKLLSDNTWTAEIIVSGHFIGNTGAWNFSSKAAADMISFSGNDFPSGGQWSGTATGTINGKTLTGNGSGSVVLNTQGPVDGTASGIWN
jgi:hypothetical protein